MKPFLALLVLLFSANAFAQGAPKVGNKPLVQVKPKGSVGCKLLNSKGHMFQSLFVELLQDSVKVRLSLCRVRHNFRHKGRLVKVRSNHLGEHFQLTAPITFLSYSLYV